MFELIRIVQDTLPVVKDSLPFAGDSSVQWAVDSVAAAVGGTVGSVVTAKLALGLGTVTRFLIEWSKKLLTKFGLLAPWQRMIFAIGWGQAAAWANVFMLSHGLPSIPADPTTGATFAAGLAVALVAMGVNGAWDAIFGKKATPLEKTA